MRVQSIAQIKNSKIIAFLLLNIILSMGCLKKSDNNQLAGFDFATEKAEILNCLNNETASAFQRDYASWQEHWIHDSTISKTYIDFTDNSCSESVGWESINEFVKTFIEENPDPEPLPELLNDIDIRLYGHGAYVTYEQVDAKRGLKREARLMEKEDGQWKIAGMHTTIYGFTE